MMTTKTWTWKGQTMSDETIRTVVWAVVAICAIQGVATYSVVKMLTSGRAMLFDRRDTTGRRVVGIDRE